MSKGKKTVGQNLGEIQVTASRVLPSATVHGIVNFASTDLE